MRKMLLVAIIGSAIVAPGCLVLDYAQAADSLIRTKRSRIEAVASPYCREVERCDRSGCYLQRICVSPCPDGYSCYPLYGAYGPYGGTAYWGAYTSTGWGYAR